MAHEGESVESEPEGESGPLLAVEPHVAKDIGVDHAAAAEFEPAGVRTGAAAGALTEHTVDVVLGRGLGEREVGGAQARVDGPAEVGARERLERSGHVGERDVAVDHQTLDLMEHGHMCGVSGIAPVYPPRHHGVDRRFAIGHDADLHR